MIRNVWSYRDLVLSLVRRQYQLRYRQSFVGILWAFVPPLVTLGAATLVFDRVLGVDTGTIPYTMFAFAALAPWTFLTNGLVFGIPSVTQAGGMVSRLAFPRAVLPLSMIGTALIDLAIAVLAFVAFAYAIGEGLPLTALWFPLLLVVEVILVAGVVFLGSALNVFARDVKLVVPLLAQLWLFLTPVMYPLSAVPESLRPWYLLNPMTGLVESFRSVLLLGRAPDVGQLFPALVGAVAVFVLGAWYFAATEERFADAI